ncbi:hypothetical protein VTK56DRAFT_1276 [Thermocarpiscus australiensis]
MCRSGCRSDHSDPSGFCFQWHTNSIVHRDSPELDAITLVGAKHAAVRRWTTSLDPRVVVVGPGSTCSKSIMTATTIAEPKPEMLAAAAALELWGALLHTWLKPSGLSASNGFPGCLSSRVIGGSYVGGKIGRWLRRCCTSPQCPDFEKYK